MDSRSFTSAEQELLEEIMIHRRDVRGNRFIKKDVSAEALDQILRVAALSPSVGFSQPWEFVIIRDDALKQQIYNNFTVEKEQSGKKFNSEQQKLYYNLKLEGIIEAPVNIAVFYKPSSAPVLGQNTMVEAGEYSVVCAIQNMWLMSRAMNIGLGWVSILNPEFVKKILMAPANNKLVAYICLGYVDKFLTTPELEQLNWEKRKPLASSIHYDTYPV